MISEPKIDTSILLIKAPINAIKIFLLGFNSSPSYPIASHRLKEYSSFPIF